MSACIHIVNKSSKAQNFDYQFRRRRARAYSLGMGTLTLEQIGQPGLALAIRAQEQKPHEAEIDAVDAERRIGLVESELQLDKFPLIIRQIA